MSTAAYRFAFFVLPVAVCVVLPAGVSGAGIDSGTPGAGAAGSSATALLAPLPRVMIEGIVELNSRFGSAAGLASRSGCDPGVFTFRT